MSAPNRDALMFHMSELLDGFTDGHTTKDYMVESLVQSMMFHYYSGRGEGFDDGVNSVRGHNV